MRAQSTQLAFRSIPLREILEFGQGGIGQMQPAEQTNGHFQSAKQRSLRFGPITLLERGQRGFEAGRAGRKLREIGRELIHELLIAQ